MKRELEGGWFQWVSLPLPALLTIQSGINQLRYATLKGIMAAKKKEIRKVAPAAAGDAPSQRILRVSIPGEVQGDADDRRVVGGRGKAAGGEAARRGEGAVAGSKCVDVLAGPVARQPHPSSAPKARVDGSGACAAGGAAPPGATRSVGQRVK